MKRKLGEILVTSGAVTGAEIDAALLDQDAGEPSRLGDLLVSSGLLSSAQLARALAAQYEVPYVELPQLPQAVLDLVPMELQRQHRVVPLRSDGTELHIAMADLANLEVVASLERQWTKVHVSVASGDEIDALHATLSGLFEAPVRVSPGGGPAIDELFGGLELEPELPQEVPPGAPPAVPVSPQVTPNALAVLPAPPPRAAALFSDLNLDSARTGISAKAPAEPPRASSESREVSGQVLTGLVEGTGPLLDLLAREGTGPVVDTPFFNSELPEPLVPTMSDEPFVSRSSSVRAPVMMREPAVGGASLAEDLPDWLRESGAAAADRPEPGAVSSAAQTAGSAALLPPQAWTGALEHLMPSKLVVGLTRALLAKGLVTEAEILAALGQNK